MTDLSAEAAAVAKRLTRAQREAVRVSTRRGFGFSAERLYHGGRSATGTALLAKNVVGVTGALTPLGLAVRALLMSQPDETRTTKEAT